VRSWRGCRRLIDARFSKLCEIRNRIFLIIGVLWIQAQAHNSCMKVIADLCVVPIGIGVSVSNEVAICERILAAAGLKTRLHAYGTNIEGDWDQVFAAVKQCHEALHAAGVPRISTNMRFGTRIDREQSMEDKVESVERKLMG
jgi:uncharacterized protein (TIGR00106 family)